MRAKKENFGNSDKFTDAPGEDGEEDEWETNEENIAKMRHALDMLPPLDRMLINLFYIDDKPVREISMICSESESNVKTRLHRARKRLRILMSEMISER